MARDELLTVAQASDELKVSRATFYRWRTLGTGPRCVKLPNGTIRIRRSELERFIALCDDFLVEPCRQVRHAGRVRQQAGMGLATAS
ncbi:helix-turn-helix domain-containing protein [Actinocrinis puniceicyclus]|uniref:Helix-turn-helix domain-containing protein n=2 Tax=Actinocrinis puniceicyclus TaxID=977794 RepID=A0A8J7WVB5_9ACTN|nr:helix-turn-helix domain-containing protein [Actinocrinis puniceicyclus]